MPEQSYQPQSPTPSEPERHAYVQSDPLRPDFQRQTPPSVSAPGYPTQPVYPPQSDAVFSPTQSGPDQSPTPQGGVYDFITEPVPLAAKSRLPGFSGGNSLPKRIALVSGGLIVLLILFNIVKGIVSGGSGVAPYLSVAQDQQALIHIVLGVGQQQSSSAQHLSITNQNFAVTTQLSVISAKSQLLTYLATNKLKVDPKLLNLKVKTSVDQQLAAAMAAGTYDQTFKDIASAKLTTYSNDLKQAYDQVKGKKGQALLRSDYDQAQLLLAQLDASAS